MQPKLFACTWHKPTQPHLGRVCRGVFCCHPRLGHQHRHPWGARRIGATHICCGIVPHRIDGAERQRCVCALCAAAVAAAAAATAATAGSTNVLAAAAARYHLARLCCSKHCFLCWLRQFNAQLLHLLQQQPLNQQVGRCVRLAKVVRMRQRLARELGAGNARQKGAAGWRPCSTSERGPLDRCNAGKLTEPEQFTRLVSSTVKPAHLHVQGFQASREGALAKARRGELVGPPAQGVGGGSCAQARRGKGAIAQSTELRQRPAGNSVSGSSATTQHQQNNHVNKTITSTDGTNPTLQPRPGCSDKTKKTLTACLGC